MAVITESLLKISQVRQKPLTELTKNTISFNWTPECEKALQVLKTELCSSTVLRYPDYKNYSTLTTDASNKGLGAILSQEEHPICYTSRTLNKAGENNSTTEKELLPIVWSVQRLRQYLLGREFKIRTDHQALTWLFNCKEPSSRLFRWRLMLEGYDYVIEYYKGKDNKAVDALSRVLPIQNKEPAMVHQQNSAIALITLFTLYKCGIFNLLKNCELKVCIHMFCVNDNVTPSNLPHVVIYRASESADPLESELSNAIGAQEVNIRSHPKK